MSTYELIRQAKQFIVAPPRSSSLQADLLQAFGIIRGLVDAIEELIEEAANGKSAVPDRIRCVHCGRLIVARFDRFGVVWKGYTRVGPMVCPRRGPRMHKPVAEVSAPYLVAFDMVRGGATIGQAAEVTGLSKREVLRVFPPEKVRAAV